MEYNIQLPQTKAFTILHVISRLPVGGAENMLLKVVRNLPGGRFKSIVCCIHEGGGIADELQRLGFRVIILHKMQGHGFDAGAVTSLCRVIKREGVHIIRTYQYHANLYGRISGILSGVPVIISSFHNLYEFPEKPKLHRRFINYLLSLFTDSLVAVSHTVASDIVRFDRVNAGKIQVVYNGIVLDDFNRQVSKEEAREHLNLPPDVLIVGTVGNLTEQKGHRFLIEAVKGMAGILVAIAGEGPQMDALKELANQSKINCMFMGSIDPVRIPLFLKALDIFCFPSLWEGFGGALIEAMASGLPIVASDIPPHREVVGDAGLFVSPGSSEEISKTIQLLAGDFSRREKLSSMSRARAKVFSLDNTIAAYEKLFEKNLKKAKLL